MPVQPLEALVFIGSGDHPWQIAQDDRSRTIPSGSHRTAARYMERHVKASLPGVDGPRFRRPAYPRIAKSSKYDGFHDT